MQKSCFLRCAWRLSEARQEDKETMQRNVIKTSQVMMRLFGGCLRPSEVVLRMIKIRQKRSDFVSRLLLAWRGNLEPEKSFSDNDG